MIIKLLVVDSNNNHIEKIDIEGSKKEVINELNKKYGDLKVKYLHNRDYNILISINDLNYDTIENYVKRNIIILKGE